MDEGLDLKKFKFPEMDQVNIVFCTLDADPVLLAEAQRRGFYNGHTEFNKMFSTLFFKGGKVKFRKDASEEFLKAAWPYLRGFMGSFAPKHEEKEAICAMILSETVESIEESK